MTTGPAVCRCLRRWPEMAAARSREAEAGAAQQSTQLPANRHPHFMTRRFAKDDGVPLDARDHPAANSIAFPNDFAIEHREPAVWRHQDRVDDRKGCRERDLPSDGRRGCRTRGPLAFSRRIVSMHLPRSLVRRDLCRSRGRFSGGRCRPGR